MGAHVARRECPQFHGDPLLTKIAQGSADAGAAKAIVVAGAGAADTSRGDIPTLGDVAAPASVETGSPEGEGGDLVRVDHVLLTRFNLPSTGVEEVIRAREGWLRQRVELFDRYCLPSVVGQHGPRPHWLVYLDPQSPDWLLDRMREHEAAGVLTPVLREEVPREALLEDLRRLVEVPGDALVTTNLDNDDGLAPDFSVRVRRAGAVHQRCAIYLVHGLIATDRNLYLRTDRDNAFCSVRESWDEPVTAWSAYHNELGRHMPVVRLAGDPGWLQVVHGRNVSNRVRGRLVRPGAHPGFAGLDLADPPAAELVGDRVLRAPVRAARDLGRGGVRRVALRILGKDRYADAKSLASRLLATSRARLGGRRQVTGSAR